MTKIYRIPTGQVEGNGANDTNTSEIRPYGEIAVYVGDNNKLELLMFDGVRTHVKSKVLNKGTFYGGDADSSDGLNYDTIKLVPDEVLRRNGSDQYLVIDPTVGEPGHIHIRAGGTIDNSGADLFLGGELNHVRVSDVGDYVRISTDANDAGATNSWNFGSNGALSLPSNLFIEPAANFAPVNGTFITQSSGEYLGIVSTGDGGTTQLGWAENSLQPSRIATLGFNAGNAGTVDIITGDYTGTTYTWVFSNTGTLTFPIGLTIENFSGMVPRIRSADGTSAVLGGASATTGEGIIIQAGNGGADDGVDPMTGGSGGGIIIAGGTGTGDFTGGNIQIFGGFDANGDFAEVTIGNGAGQFHFYGNGNLTFPSGGDVTFDNSATSYIYGITGIEFADGTTQTTAFVIGTAPLSSTSTGTVGTMAYDASYLYVCTATNSWQRIGWDSTPW